MDLFLQITMCLMILGAGVAILLARKQKNHLISIIKQWRKNPTKMDLALATTKQILKELQARSQPIIMIVPELTKASEESILKIYVMGIQADDARMILQGAGELLGKDDVPTSMDDI